jgi:signal transduction histidine kinase
MLKQYSVEIEELTIINERANVAQELHDSLGHSLIALTMNLEYAENIFDSTPEKAKEIISKSYNISKECIMNLRKAVSTLRERKIIKELRESINEIFYTFKEIDKIKFNFKMEETIESTNPDIKYCIYKTIKESITNGIKHGNATIFHIDILNVKNQIYLTIKDNGLGCNKIIKSNGLKGIESRVNKLGGSVSFAYGTHCGFTIKVKIPVLE